MRITHIINQNTFEEYNPSPQSLQLIGENERKIIAENFQWDQDYCASLADLCVRAIAKYFEEKPVLDELPCQDGDYLLEILKCDIPIEFMFTKIYYDYYWQRRYEEEFGVCLRLKPKNWSWKSLYVERFVQFKIENAQPQYGDEYEMDDLLTLCNIYVKLLVVTQLQCWKPPLNIEKEDYPENYPTDHISFIPIFSKLNLIEELEIIYGMNHMGFEEFTWRAFEISIQDCLKLGKSLESLKFLKVLRLHKSRIEDVHARALCQGLIKNQTVEELDLSNCEIKNDGCLCIAKVLGVHPKLKILNLCNNLIEQAGAEGLGFALLLDTCAPLVTLNLRLNPLGHEGCMGVFRSLVRGDKPEELNLAACGFEELTGERLGNVLKINLALKRLDISNNWLDEEGGDHIIAGLMVNRNIKYLDVRETDITRQQRRMIKSLLHRNITGDDVQSDMNSEEEILEGSSEENEEGEG